MQRCFSMESNKNLIIERSAQAWGVSLEDATRLFGINHQKALRINKLKQSKKITAKLIKQFGLIPISWCSGAYAITKNYQEVSRSNYFNEGYFILQDQASFVPVLALNPTSGERILDICAAPGAKTTHIASITSNKAKLFANDSSKNRLFKLRKLTKQFGVECELSLYDGRNLTSKYNRNSFDKILLDAPCSGEASIINDDLKTSQNWTFAKVKRLSRLQEQLILSAYDMLKPGGTLVYSTCTISPEENEKVVSRLLKRRTAEITDIEIKIDGKLEGLVFWNDKKYSSQIKKTVRLLPTQNHEAFFIAKIIKPVDLSIDEYQYKV